MLVGLKFMVGAFLLAALFSAAYEKIHFGSSDDAMLDVALLTSAIATVASALPGLTHGGELLLSVIGELMLCVIASALAIYGRGFLVKEELPPSDPAASRCVIRGRGSGAATSSCALASLSGRAYFCSRKPSTRSA